MLFVVRLRQRRSKRVAVWATLAAATVTVAAVLALVLQDSEPTPDVPQTAVASEGPTPEPGRAGAGSDSAAPDAPEASTAAAEAFDVADAPTAPSESEALSAAPPAPSDGGGESASVETAPTTGEPGGDSAAVAASAAAEVQVIPPTIRQGETALVRLSAVSAAEAVITVGDFSLPMVEEDGAWVGYVPIPPLSATGLYTLVIDVFDSAGAYQETHLAQLDVVDAAAGVEHITLDPDTAALLAPELVAFDDNVRFVLHTGVSGPRLWSGPWQLPLQGEANGPFGVLRSYNDAPPRSWHHGHDISADSGTPIVAPAAGVVVFADELPVHGMGVIIDHGAGVYSGYWHMSAIVVREGASVGRGDALGEVGATGAVTGPHLHWEVIIHGRDVNPMQWLDARLSQ
ncbi:MAG: peptidoglycan DD-metalloendopeptidase family protein [Dehalococcoidia bacterium]